MARPPKHDWEALYKEYTAGDFKTVTCFAEIKGIHPFAVQREFRKFRDGHNKTKLPDKTKQNSGTQQNKTKPPMPSPGRCEAIGHKSGERCLNMAQPGQRFCTFHMDGRDGQCTAKSKQTGVRCKNKAEPGKTKCKFHGGRSTGPPPGVKTALKTGEYEVIWFDTLDEEESILVTQIETDPVKLADESIRLLSIRERRMMRRIQDLKKGLTEKQRRVLHERKKVKEAVEVYDENTGQTRVITVPREDLIVTEITETDYRVIDDILRIEEALTRVQEKKIRAIELKHRLEVDGHTDKENLLDEVLDEEGLAE